MNADGSGNNKRLQNNQNGGRADVSQQSTTSSEKPKKLAEPTARCVQDVEPEDDSGTIRQCANEVYLIYFILSI